MNIDPCYQGDAPMTTQKFHIPKISCGHCTRTIENELKELAGIQNVEGDILAKTITVNFQAPATEAQIRATLKEINYPAAP
jgi:copper chaperone CopZ